MYGENGQIPEQEQGYKGIFVILSYTSYYKYHDM